MEVYKKKKFGRILFISIVILAMFFTGFIAGGSFIYGLTSPEIDELQYQVGSIQNNNDNLEYQNITYFYNDTSLSELYKKVKDSIITIYGTVAYHSFFRTQYTEVQGSGFVYDYNSEFFVITNNHVVSAAENIIVTFSNGNGYPAELIGSDVYSDLAILSVDAPMEEFNPLEIVSSSSLEVGDPVIAIGNPLGLDGTMTTGIVSQVGRTIEESLAGSFPIANIIQTTVAINPGNSGGPLLNYKGQVVGITTAIIEDSEGLGFSIPSNTILREIESLIEYGYFDKHPWLGVSGIDMTYQIAEALDTDITYGWLISSVTPNSAADEAGIIGGNRQLQIVDKWVVLGGDIIIAVDGIRIIDGDSLMSYLEEFTLPNQLITITVVRENKQIDLEVELGQRPVM